MATQSPKIVTRKGKIKKDNSVETSKKRTETRKVREETHVGYEGWWRLLILQRVPLDILEPRMPPDLVEIHVCGTCRPLVRVPVEHLVLHRRRNTSRNQGSSKYVTSVSAHDTLQNDENANTTAPLVGGRARDMTDDKRSSPNHPLSDSQQPRVAFILDTTLTRPDSDKENSDKDLTQIMYSPTLKTACPLSNTSPRHSLET